MNMVYCRYCGKLIGEDSAFCHHCGMEQKEKKEKAKRQFLIKRFWKKIIHLKSERKVGLFLILLSIIGVMGCFDMPYRYGEQTPPDMRHLSLAAGLIAGAYLLKSTSKTNKNSN